MSALSPGLYARDTRLSWLRLLHYWWPLALGWSITVVMHRATGRAVDSVGMLALLSGILCAYSLDRWLDRAERPIASWLPATLLTVGLVSAAACGVAMLQLPATTAALIPVLAVTALAYPQLKRHPATKLVLLPVIWVWAPAALPFNDGSWAGWHLLVQPVVAPLLLLVASGCLLCDLKDEATDRSRGVWSLPARVGGQTTVRIAAALALLATLMALAQHRPAVAIGGLALSAVTLLPAMLATDAAGPLIVDMILTLPGVLIAARLV